MTSKEALKKLSNDLGNYSPFQRKINIIKQDLSRLEKLEKENKEIEELYLNENKHWCETIDSLRKENTKLKNAIEIIKNKDVDIVYLLTTDLEDYNQTIYDFGGENILTQEEYELLKKVFGE